MKRSSVLVAAALFFLALSTIAHAAIVNGTVFCDANQDGRIDTGDAAIPGVLVVITNENNSFSNSAVTAADGSFSIQIPNPSSSGAVRDPLSQIFVEMLDDTTLPAGSSILIPLAVTNLTSTPAYFISFVTTANQTNLLFISGSGNSSSGNWLINNAGCGSIGSIGNCKLSGSGRINGHRSADHTFSGTILSGNTPSGQWTDVSHSLGLRLTSTAIQSVNCGTGSIEFTGTGILRGRGVSRGLGNSVLFTAEVENASDGNAPKSISGQSYYLRVYTADGTTLESVSTDSLDPTDIAPEPITASHLRLRGD